MTREAKQETFQVEVEPHLGGRWTLLIDPRGRQWLWSRPDPARSSVRDGQPFVDVGGIEECFPTINGKPDHGAVWTQRWVPDGEGLVVTGEDFALHRRITVGTEVVASYELVAAPGLRFIWAMHALLQPDVGTEVLAPNGHPTSCWAGAREPVEGRWPQPLGVPWSALHDDDGSAAFVVLPGLDQVSVKAPDGGALRFRLTAPGQPGAIGVWRNLGGFPVDPHSPYRSLGVEPMIGLVPDLALADEHQAGLVPEHGRVRWSVTIDTGGPQESGNCGR